MNSTPSLNYGISSPGIGGKIKRRYSDFIVEEIQKNGTCCTMGTFLKEHREEQNIQVPENTENKEYIHMDLEKLNMESTEAFRILSRALRVSQKRIGYAGLKDKRGITCQRISIWKPDIELLKKFRVPRMALRNFEWSNNRIELGYSQGNQFTITIRAIELNQSELEKRLNAIIKELENGVPNYFGMQRFGGIRQVTHKVGKCIIQDDAPQAVMIYLSAPAEKEEAETQEARRIIREEHDFKKALKVFPFKYRFEIAMLNHLVKYPNDYVGAIQRLPRKIRYLLTHAYQSHLFNRFIQERLTQGIGLIVCGEEPVNTEGIPMGLIPGYDSEFTPGKIGEIERNIMQEEGITFEQFQIKKIAECSCKGVRKEIKLIPQNIQLKNIQVDEFFPGTLACTISFQLTKGNYATTIVQSIIQTELD